MLINTVSTLALYCSRCGKIEMHDISRFTLKSSVGSELTCGCGQRLATVSGVGHDQYLLDIPCVVCETSHIVCVDVKDFWQGRVNKIYCAAANLELGFSGERRAIEQAIAVQQREFDSMVRDMTSEEYVDNPQVMFEVLNKVHDIAERGGVYCRCGGNIIEADVQPDSIELVCVHCNGRRVIAAKTEEDLEAVKAFATIEIGPGRRSHRR
jgi:hypothetical protein